MASTLGSGLASTFGVGDGCVLSGFGFFGNDVEFDLVGGASVGVLAFLCSDAVFGNSDFWGAIGGGLFTGFGLEGGGPGGVLPLLGLAGGPGGPDFPAPKPRSFFSNSRAKTEKL